MPPDELVAAEDNSADMAKYHNLVGKANLLYGQGQTVLRVAAEVKAVIDGMDWQGKRATRFRKEWDKTHVDLENWGRGLVALSDEVMEEANKYKSAI